MTAKSMAANVQASAAYCGSYASVETMNCGKKAEKNK
jgi:hypothetical protein